MSFGTINNDDDDDDDTLHIEIFNTLRKWLASVMHPVLICIKLTQSLFVYLHITLQEFP